MATQSFFVSLLNVISEMAPYLLLVNVQSH